MARSRYVRLRNSEEGGGEKFGEEATEREKLTDATSTQDNN